MHVSIEKIVRQAKEDIRHDETTNRRSRHAIAPNRTQEQSEKQFFFDRTPDDSAQEFVIADGHARVVVHEPEQDRGTDDVVPDDVSKLRADARAFE